MFTSYRPGGRAVTTDLAHTVEWVEVELFSRVECYPFVLTFFVFARDERNAHWSHLFARVWLSRLPTILKCSLFVDTFLGAKRRAVKGNGLCSLRRHCWRGVYEWGTSRAYRPTTTLISGMTHAVLWNGDSRRPAH